MRDPNTIIVEDYITDVIRELLPNGELQSVSSVGGHPSIKLNSLNKTFQASDYYIQPANKDFIHYTSFENLVNIISTNSLRIYDLNKMDDINELSFSAESSGIMDVSNEKFNDLKSFVHSFSFNSNDLSEEDEFNMWRLYGYNGNGVGLVFNFLNDCDYWRDFHLSKVYYSCNSECSNFYKLNASLKKHKDFLKKIESESLIKYEAEWQALPIDFFKLFAFHKQSIYNIENEFRLLHFYDDDKKITKFYTGNRQLKTLSYVELPLYEIDSITSTDCVPVIKIEEVVLGYGFNENDVDKVKNLLVNINAKGKKQVVTPNVRITALKKKFYTEK